MGAQPGQAPERQEVADRPETVAAVGRAWQSPNHSQQSRDGNTTIVVIAIS